MKNFWKLFLLTLTMSIFLTSCEDTYKNNLWDQYHRKSNTSSKLHSKWSEIQNRESAIDYNYSAYNIDD